MNRFFMLQAAMITVAIAPLASASVYQFSFTGGGITSSGTITAVLAPNDISGVSTAGTYEVTGITGTFSDTNDGVSGNITGLYSPTSYVSALAATAANPVAYTSGGLSYDDLFFPGGNSAADCPNYPFSGGDFDVFGVAFNISGGYVGDFFSDGVRPNSSSAVEAAADANASSLLDDPNAGTHGKVIGVVGNFDATAPEPGSLFLFGAGLTATAVLRLKRYRGRKG